MNIELGHTIQKPVQDWNEYAEMATWCNANNAHIEDRETCYEVVANVEHMPTVLDYDNALEKHLTEERCARGYTTREPDYYLHSSVPRWHHDAEDWIAHRDEVMLYGLQVENDYAAGNPIPQLEEFIALMPKIVWTYTDETEE